MLPALPVYGPETRTVGFNVSTLVVVPGTGEEARGLLIRDLDFIFPFGFFIIALKFLLRIVLLASGTIRHDPQSELDDEELVHAHKRDDDAAKGLL